MTIAVKPPRELTWWCEVSIRGGDWRRVDGGSGLADPVDCFLVKEGDEIPEDVAVVGLEGMARSPIAN